MTNITILDVPENIVKKYWKTIKYSNAMRFESKKRIESIQEEKLTYRDDSEIKNMWKSSTITSNSF